MRSRLDANPTEGRQLRHSTRQHAMRWNPETKTSVAATCPTWRNTTGRKNVTATQVPGKDEALKSRSARKRSTTEPADTTTKKRGVKCRRVDSHTESESTSSKSHFSAKSSKSSSCASLRYDQQKNEGEVFLSPEGAAGLPAQTSSLPGDFPAAVHWPSQNGEYTDQLDPRKATEADRIIIDKEKYALDIQRAMIADEDGDRPLHIAVVHEDTPLVRRLCSLMRCVGASVDLFNFMRQTPLHLAVIIGNAEVVEALLEEGASVQLQDRNGRTTIHLGVKYFSEKCLRTIIQHPTSRAILDHYDYDGYTSLHLAVFKKNHIAINILHHAGCNMNSKDGKSGKTPLFHAVTLNDVDTVHLLLKCGASVEESDYSGVTPLEEAAQSSDTQMMKVLEDCSKLFKKSNSEAITEIPNSHVVRQNQRKSYSEVTCDMGTSLVQKSSGVQHRRTTRSRRFTVESLIS